MGVDADGRRELLGLKVGDSESESEPFWREFLVSLKQRGLSGVRLVISVGEAFPGGVAHVGLTKAVGRMVQGCSWQRCRVHFARKLLQTVPKAQQEMVAAMLTAKFPRAADLMATAREDVLAFRHCPASHWRKLWSTNLLERVNEEI
jgi:putative transposase